MFEQKRYVSSKLKPYKRSLEKRYKSIAIKTLQGRGGWKLRRVYPVLALLVLIFSQLIPLISVTPSQVAAANLGTVETLVSGLNQPAAIDVNAQGDIYFTEDAGCSVNKIQAGTTTVERIVSGGEFGYVGGAFDAQGNFWYTAYWSGNIYRLPAGSTTPQLFTTIGGEGPRGIDVDSNGNLYVVWFNQNKILKIAPDKSVTELASATGIESIAVDSKGNVYYDSNGDIYRIAAGTTSPSLYISAAAARNLYVDENDALYYMETSGGVVYIMRVAASSITPENILQLPTGRPFRMAVRAGTVYVTFYEANYIAKAPTSTFSVTVAVILAKFSDNNPAPEQKHNATYYIDSVVPRLQKYYYDISYGRIGLQFTFFNNSDGSWKYSLDHDHAYYGSGIGNSIIDTVLGKNREKQFTEDCINKVNAKEDVNFSLYDIVICVHSGTDESVAPDYGTQSDMWTSAFCVDSYPPFITSDGEKVNNRIVIAEKENEPFEMGLWAHEIGHALGSILKGYPLPDLYSGSGNGNVYTWDLMGDGYNCVIAVSPPSSNVVSAPSHMSVYSKAVLGWINP